MKFIIYVYLLFIPVFGSSIGDQMTANVQVSINATTEQVPTESAKLSIIDQPSIVVSVKGMVCSFCAQGIQKTFQKQSAVRAVLFNLEDATVSIKLKRFRKLSDHKIRKIITDAGYDVGDIQRY